MMERDHMNQNVPRDPTGYSSCPSGMRLMHPPVHYEEPSGIRMMNQPTTQPAMHNMAQQQEQQQCQYPQQTDRWQPQPGRLIILSLNHCLIGFTIILKIQAISVSHPCIKSMH